MTILNGTYSLINSVLYLVYPFASRSAAGTNSNAAELIQYLIQPLSTGPSLNTCHRCPFDDELFISVLSMPNLLSDLLSTIVSCIGLVKLGRQVPESNLSVEEKSGVPSITST